MSLSEFDPIGRELCPDGACVGIVGPDGKCKECGRLGERPLDPRLRGLRAVDEAEAQPPLDGPDGEPRECCGDGSCVGLLGPDGHCRECGQPGRAVADSVALASDEDESVPFAVEDVSFEDRTLCSDGNCVGLIGANGRCKLCGLGAAGG